MQPIDSARIAVLIPCLNEEAGVAAVVAGFRAALPACEVHVYDNGSIDRTVALATAAGAIVRSESRRGKGNVVRRMFADIDADIYVMADGDSTYDPRCASAMIRLLRREKLDMVVGTRVAQQDEAYRPGHRTGNRLLGYVVSRLFGNRFSDMLSGYRVFSRRFVKSFPAMSSGFETETELTIHALELNLPIGEVETPYQTRVQGSASKLQTWTDGYRIVRLIVVLFKNEQPFKFFGLIALVLIAVALALGVPVIVTYFHTGLVTRQPTAILATGLVLMSCLSFVAGLVLDTVTRGRREMRRLAYLAIAPPPD